MNRHDRIKAVARAIEEDRRIIAHDIEALEALQKHEVSEDLRKEMIVVLREDIEIRQGLIDVRKKQLEELEGCHEPSGALPEVGEN